MLRTFWAQLIELGWLFGLPLFGMAVSHGKKTKVFLDDSGGSRVEITSYMSQAALNTMRDTAETTVFGNEDKTYVAGVRDRTFSGSGNFDPALDAILFAALGTDVTKTLEYAPQGDGSGLLKYSFEALVTSYDIEGDTGSKVGCSFELQGTGAVTRATY
jgi:hypothetical protein